MKPLALRDQELAVLHRAFRRFPCVREVRLFGSRATGHLRPMRGTARLMKGLGFRCVQCVNRAYGRTGTLFEGRFRSSLIEGDGYLLTCQRCIELNPVRAGLGGDPGEDPWSSYRANALGIPNPLLTPHPLYAGLGETDEARRASTGPR